MKRSKRWLAVAGLWLAFVWWIPFGLAQTGTVAPSSAAARGAGIAPATATPPSGAAAVPAAAATVAGVQSAAFIVRPNDHPDDTALGQRLFEQAVDGSRVDPFNWAVHVYKSQHRIELYYKNQLFRTYHAVFGRGRLAGPKAWEGDSRTPEGAYLIIAKHRSPRFRWFLKLNYPNATDEARFAELRASHTIPIRSREGSLVGIHGTDSPILNLEDVNWTLGCISLDNNDIAEMARLLPVGTLVVINP
jgi:L,D-peptidoglycan transpeptidase YkuD (ErfK/YbiS/YcfS/YnhG family)